MAVKKGNLDQFLNVGSMYSDNNKHLRSIFIDKVDENEIVPDNFLESSLNNKIQASETRLEHIRNTIGSQDSNNSPKKNRATTAKIPSNGTHKEHVRSTTGTQVEHIRNTNRAHQGYVGKLGNTTGTQIEHVKEHAYDHIRNTIGTQLGHIRDTSYGLSYLAGIQKQIILLFYSSCKKNRSHVTEEFSLENIASTLKIKIGSVKTSLRRLEEKGFIRGTRFKKGRGGWTQFELLDETYRELLESEKEHNWNTIGTQKGHEYDTERNTERNTRTLSSSSDIKTTTTELNDEWNFDVSPYSHFGFGVTQLKQLIMLGKISASEVEQSLIEFNYDIENNTLPHIKTNKINFLMGLLRNGSSYISENYRNEQEKIIKLMADRAAQKGKAQMEEKFIAWEYELKNDQREEIIRKMPTHLIIQYKTNGLNQKEVKKWLIDYYLQNVSCRT